MRQAATLLTYARKKAGLSQRELAERSGVAQPAIARIERDHVTPRFDTLQRLLASCRFRITLEPERGAGVDRSVIRELRSLRPEERLIRAGVEGRNLEDLERAIEA